MRSSSPARARANAGPPRVSDAEAIDLLRTILDRAGFTEQGVREALGERTNRLQLKRIDFPLYERRLSAPRELHALIRLFMMQLWIDDGEARRALAPLSLDRLIGLGLLESGSQGVHSRSALAICNGLIIAHDRAEEEGAELEADHVLGVNPSALTLANLTVRRAATRTLDIGAGSGIQALLASTHSAQVIATDTNPRALAYLAFNARLNRIKNVECRQGSLFEPVAGSRFDLITCNPPYVISPDSEYIFRDSGRPRDAICEEVVREAPAYLEEGGYACILCNWAHKRNEDWSQPLRRWAENNGCDTWALRGGTEDPLSYAAGWTRERDQTKYAGALDRWQAYYARSGIEAVSVGAVLLRRCAAGTRGWFRADDLPAKPAESCNDHILRVFETESHLRQTSETGLLATKFCLAPGHCLQQQLRYEGGELECDKRQLGFERGLRFQCNLDVHSLCLVSHCDGKHTLAEAVVELGRSTGVPVEQIRSRAVAVVRQLLACGFLIPVFAGRAPTPSRRVAGPGVGDPAGESIATA